MSSYVNSRAVSSRVKQSVCMTYIMYDKRMDMPSKYLKEMEQCMGSILAGSQWKGLVQTVRVRACKGLS